MVTNRLTKFFTRFILLAAAVGLLGGMAWVVRGRTQSESASESGAAKPSVTARLFTVEAKQREATRSLIGTVQARYETELAFRVGGKIAKRLVDVGSRVSAGEVLFELDLTDYELQLESAAADLASAEATYKQAAADEVRMRALQTSRSVSDDEYDRALAQRDVAAARRTAANRALELARNRLQYTVLEAPTAGVITQIMAEGGQVVADGRGVAKLAQGNELEVVVGVPERLVSGLADAAERVTFWSLPGVESRTKLRELSPTADPVARTYEARFTIVDVPPALQLGMSATLHMNCGIDGDSIAIPSSALAGRPERLVSVQGAKSDAPIVWKVLDDAGHIGAIPVEIVRYGQEQVIVRGELADGDRIVSAGVHKLDSGVTVRNWEELK